MHNILLACWGNYYAVDYTINILGTLHTTSVSDYLTKDSYNLIMKPCTNNNNNNNNNNNKL